MIRSVNFSYGMKSQTHASISKTVGKGSAPERRELVGTRSEKNLIRAEKPECLVQEFSSKNTNGDSTNSAAALRSAIRNEISSYLFEYIEGFHIPTHFLSKLSTTEMLVRWTDNIPIEVCVDNLSSKSFSERYGLPESQLFDFPIIEHYYLKKDGTRLLANEYHFFALNVVSPEEFKHINRIASKVNAVLRGLCDRRQLTLVHLTLYFGRSHGQLFVIDELSPSTFHIIEKEHARNYHGTNHDLDEAALAGLRDRLMLKV